MNAPIKPSATPDLSEPANEYGMMAHSKIPAPAPSVLMEIQQRNFLALTAINLSLLEGMQALIQRHAELLRKNMEMNEELFNGTLPPSLENNFSRQTKASRNAISQYIRNAQDAAEIFTACHTKIIATVSERMSAGLKELRELTPNGSAATP